MLWGAGIKVPDDLTGLLSRLNEGEAPAEVGPYVERRLRCPRHCFKT